MVTILEVPPPADVDDPQAWACRAEARLWNAETSAQFGYDDLNEPEAAAARLAVPSPHRRTLRWVALDDPADTSSLVGASAVSLTLQDNRTIATLQVVVRPDRRRQGIGSRLLEAAERRAVAEGRTTLQCWVTQVGSPEPDHPGVLRPREGSGLLDGNHPAARFMRGRGYSLEQVEVHSMVRLPVPAEVIDPLATQAAAKVGDGYRLLNWVDRCPDELVDGFAALRAAMIDAPAAGMAIEEESWDADRVRTAERRWAEAGVTTVTSVARQVGTGELAGFTQLIRFAERKDSAIQEDTVVLAAHRGHRLGMHLKIANLRLIDRLWPEVRRIHTWNADENDYMRSINIALGFRPESAEGAWQKIAT